jgi:glycosyltransferase involved in cell wall biosynthesis
VQALGRFNLRLIASRAGSPSQVVQSITSALVREFDRTAFTGVLLADWEEVFNGPSLQRMFEVIRAAGLAVYLETAPPVFLKNRKVLQSDCISGLVVRNASILFNGEKRDYFQLASLQSTIKAFVSESCLRDFVVMAWETVDDNVVVSNAVQRRAVQWCNFYSVLTWIGSKSALIDASINFKTLEPLSAFGWLKEAEIMNVHGNWRSNTTILRHAGERIEWGELAAIFPGLGDLLAEKEYPPVERSPSHLVLQGPPEWLSESRPLGNPLSVSPSGTEYAGLGCFPLGSEVTATGFAEILQSQQKLKALGLLHPVDETKIQSIGSLLRQFHDSFLLSDSSQELSVATAVKELSILACNNSIRVSLGLDSGFRRSSENRFWSVYQTDPDGIEIYVSKSARGLVGTVLHTFLSSKGFSRHLCFEVETALSRWSKDLVQDSSLPRRLVQDIDVLTPTECLLYLRHLTLTDAKTELSHTICAYIRRKLIEAPTLSQLRDLNTAGYLSSEVTPEQVIQSRISWYRSQGCEYPSPGKSLALFEQIQGTFSEILKYRREHDLATITSSLSSLVEKGQIDAYVDIAVMSLFCAARKAAFDEIYTEVTDRNPLFNNQSDQAAAFAESFALGSRCEAYFDMSPSAFGKLLSDRFRAYYSQHPPPLWVNGAPELATAYAGAQIDVDPEDAIRPMPGYQRFTFLSVFAIPALIDIILLTFIGRGLYLSAFMPYEDMKMATTALMIALLLSGAVGTWISCGGSYYLVSMAFSAMNIFVLTRLIAGLAFTFVGGLIGFIAISCVKGPRAGIIFYLYLFGLTAYLTLFATIACFSYPGSSFLSGRKIIIACILILFLSPVITAFTGFDSLVYPIVLYGFISLLFIGLRSVASDWVTWYQNIRNTDDVEIRKWYISTFAGNDEKAFESMSDPAALKLSRQALLRAVLAERNKGIFSKATSDKLVLELARNWDSINFLVNWYCRYADVPRPIPFSSSWNIQTKVALDTLRNAQKGIRLHNAFIHWRQAGEEIGCGMLYFIIALLDKWVLLLCGDRLIGLSASLTDANRMAVGLGLAYYLIGAVLIDTKAQHLHELIGKHPPEAVKSAKDIRAFQKRDVRIKRYVYWTTLFKFLMWHVWGFALTGSLVWTFQGSLEAMVMFCAYVLAYTGLLWYQYTKIFSGPHALKPLMAGVIIGLPVGIAIKVSRPDFIYSSVIALGISTWSVAILSLWTAKIGMPKKVQSPVELGRTFHAYVAPWADPEWSQQELQTFYEDIVSKPHSPRLLLSTQSQLGLQVKSILLSRKAELRISEAFPKLDSVIEWAMAAWERNKISINLVYRDDLGAGIRALSCTRDDHLNILIGIGQVFDRRLDTAEHAQVIAETLVHAACESLLNVPHEYALFAESLVAADVSETMTRQMSEERDKSLITKWANNELTRHLCLGFQCDLDWDKLPSEIRVSLVNRCLGKTCQISERQWQWLEETLCKFDTDSLNVHTARCNLGCAIAATALDYSRQESGEPTVSKGAETKGYITHIPEKLPLSNRLFSGLWHQIATLVKFIVIAMVADPEFHRELDYVMKDRSRFIRVPSIFFLSMIWIYARKVQNLGLMFFLFHGRQNIQRLWNETKGTTVKLKRGRVIIQGLDGTFTAFRHDGPDGGFKMCIYLGEHRSEPKDRKSLKYVNTYTTEMLLLVREEFENGDLLNEYHYDYRSPAKKGFKLSRPLNPRLPLGRRCVSGKNRLQRLQYNRSGFIDGGSYTKDGNLIRFQYHYRKNPRFGDELLRAEFVLNYMSCTVSWCAPPRRHPEKIDRWIPHAKITEATFVHGSDVYESRWLYDHKFHPTIFTSLNGQKVQTPPMIENDHLGVLAKPKYTCFFQDNPLFFCNNLKTNPLSRFLGLTKRRFPVSTSRARSLIWKAWKERVDYDGVIVRWIDERLLRRDKVLAPYWRSRDRGDLASAKKYLEQRADAIMASADVDDTVSSWTPLAVKMGDLLNFGPGGDAVLFTRSKEFIFDNDETLHVLAADNGTWPNEGGGVSACRRDMINSLRTIKWHMICEAAHDFGIPKHQTEQNVQSLKVIPLWGLDFLTPTHGLFKNKLDAEVQDYATSVTELDIKMNFIPILTALVKGARAVHLSNADIKQATRALVNLNTYFETYRHWGQVWTSEIVKESWRELWLTQEMPNAVPSCQWFDTELPTLGHLDTALELWFRYLFIFSIPVPQKIPSVFQASHHSVSASYGVVCKIKRGCTLQIWDHAISWRETNLCMSSALCKLPPFVRNALLGLMRLTSVLTLHHADIVSPCADFFNPGWEVEIGTCQGNLEHRNSFRRKVDPVVNGITDMQKFAPVKEIKSQRPTVTMLSHVWYAKDIKTAILAADLIINQWRFDDYHLDIYGAIDKAPTYSTECQELIASKGLRGRVTLRGTADPMEVLENTWLFLNSSLSEGLPLALGEAALTGAPVVCTDVGASLRVLSDPDDFSRFSAVVAPNDAQALARAQIHMLAMLGEWSQYSEDTEPVPILSSSPSADEVAKITRRMYEKSEQRRKLGMMTRKIVQKSFSGERYLREHEQMLWIGKSLSRPRTIAGRGSGGTLDPLETPSDLRDTTPIEGEMLTIPRAAVTSWRSSASSSFISASSHGPMVHGHGQGPSFGRPVSSDQDESRPSTEGVGSSVRGSYLPVFAPRDLLALPPPPAGEGLLRGLRGEELLQYRNSDVSSIERDELNLSDRSVVEIEKGA